MEKAIKEFESDSKAKAGFVIAFILLLAAIIISLYNNKNLQKRANDIEHTTDVMLSMEYLLSKLKDAETGVRGYLLTGKDEFLEPYINSNQKIDSVYAWLRVQTKENSLQQKRIGRVRLKIIDRFAILDLSKLLFEKNNKIVDDSLKNILHRSKNVMDGLRVAVRELQTEEKKFLNEREEKFRTVIHNLNLFSIIAFALAFVLFITGTIVYLKESKTRKLAAERIGEFQNELKKRIAQLALANEELVRMKAQEKFSATGRIARTIAHEVRNPLTNINLATDQLKADFLGNNEDAVFLFEMIARNSQRINLLISELLQSTKFAELHVARISMKNLLDETLFVAADRVQLTGTVINKQFDDENILVSADKDRMKIALLNLIVNALEAMQESVIKILTIEVKIIDNKCLVIISDTGKGMNEEELSKLFEPYFTNKQNGNGLGLTNTQNIILNHKGEIHVKSEMGVGTTFTLTLNCIN